jgi:23S rRNA pseudouridine1911/1915/1917 synthase
MTHTHTDNNNNNNHTDNDDEYGALPLDLIDIQQADTDTQPLHEHHRLVADPNQGATRLDKFVADRLPNTSRSKVQNAIDAQHILVNDQCFKANYQIKPGDVVTVVMPNPPHIKTLTPENIDLNIIYEDADVLVINKPSGLVVHPGHGNYTGTLVHGLLHHFNNLPTNNSGNDRPGLVHRIDKETSGLLVIAKTETAMNHLARQFFDHSIQRNYQALVWGDVANDSGTITGHLDRSPKDRRVMTVFPDGRQGKHAITHYKLIERFGYVTLLEFTLETGRTHQIRAHSQYIKHPIFNDSTYGGNKILRGTTFTKYKQFVENCFTKMPRVALHAKTLGFVHPTTGKDMFFEAPLPPDFDAVINSWRNYTHYKPLEIEEIS